MTGDIKRADIRGEGVCKGGMTPSCFSKLVEVPVASQITILAPKKPIPYLDMGYSLFFT